MDEMFGVSMNAIMYVLLGILGVCLCSVLYVVLRNRIMFQMGIRNIPRRAAQTVLIVLGLMLSTLIISAAFTTGDTVDASISNQTFSLMGHMDEALLHRSQDNGGGGVGSDAAIPDEVVAAIEEEVANNPNIDGILPVMFQAVPVVNARNGLSSPRANIVGLEPEKTEAFPDFVSISGESVELADLADDEVYVNESLADEAGIESGDVIRLFVQSEPVEFRVADVVEDRMVTGVFDFETRDGLVTRLDVVRGLLGRPDEVDVIGVSNAGGVRSGLEVSGEVTASLERAIENRGLDLEVEEFKREAVNDAEQAGNFMATFFLIFGLFSIAAGILLILMIFVMLAAERKPELGMARAIGTKRSHLVQTFLSEGMAYNLGAAAVGAALGVLLSFGITRIMARIFAEFDLDIEPHVTGRSVIISYSLGVVLTFVTVTFSSWRVSKLNIVAAIRDITETGGGRMGWRSLASSIACAALGALLLWAGMSGDLAFPFALGFSLIIGGVAVILRYLNAPARPVFTVMGLFLLLIWGLVAGGRLESLFGRLEGDMEMFFLSGISMVAASTFVLVYNADIILTFLSSVGGRFGRMLPAMKTAVAYPLANKFRTGMTLAMFSLIIFALVMMSAMNVNFDRVMLSDAGRGGWDVLVEENEANPLGDDLAGSLTRAGYQGTGEFRAVGRLKQAERFSFPEICQEPCDDYTSYPVRGVSTSFVRGSDIPLEARAIGYDSDEEVWQKLGLGGDVAIIDGFTIREGFNFGESFSLKGVDEGQRVFDPLTLNVRDPVSGAEKEVRIIGVVAFGSSAPFMGVLLPEDAFRELFGVQGPSQYYIGLKDPGRAPGVADDIESALTLTGAQASSIKENIDEDQALSRNFFRLMQAFMGLGLFVGIAAVGVVAFRSVVERRQQIGMLRAIGYTRGTVALSFVLESAFVAALGIVSGVGLAIWLAYFLITSDDFPTSDAGFVIPWLQIALISAFAFVASLFMTIIPSRQAAGVPIAEALRYE